MKISSQILKSEKYIYIALIVIAFFMVLTSTYCPFNFRRMHVDSSVYISIAQGITKGFLPYKDFVDNKGPLTYLISVPGLLFGGFTGIWITEIIFMFFSVLFAWKTALIFGNKFTSLLGTIFSFVILLAFFSVNAGTEEYSLPFLMISLYIFSKYYFTGKQHIGIFELIFLGACFSCAIMIKLNMFPLWAGFCLVIFIENIIKRHFLQLVKYILGFCTGIIIIFIPFFLYLKINGIIFDFWNLVVLGGADRGFGSESIKDMAKNFYAVISRNYSFLPLFFGLYLVIKNFRQQHFSYWVGFTFSYVLMLLFLSLSSGGSHYNISLIPYFVITLTVIMEKLDFKFLKKNKKNVLVVFLCLAFSEGLVKYLFDLSKIFHDDSGTMLIKAGKIIDDNTKQGDTIINLGFNGYIYPFTQRDIASRYLYQGSGLNYISGAQEAFISDILTKKPAIITVFTAEDGGYGQYMENWHKPIFEMMEKEYRLLSGEYGFNIFIRDN